ncbi:MAG: metallophosphoesterase [Ferrovibrio sp.]|uniref:metallophosphoesterase family protein n=1 Tax=Ferrovibrio sp. TaxID=1917215 RepID=UPI002621272E|nr:metallophosphoesterase [Ferrovibrio sp.]MCW0232192.1 metallophosphoesterase [Ferrovibrio sp.]
MRIALITDTHVAPHAPAFNANWLVAKEFIAELGTDWTIHLGDITVNGAHDDSHYDCAMALAQNWPGRLQFLPGNHDVGDNPPGPGVPVKDLLQPERLARYRTVFGPDYWRLDLAGWRLLGLNAQLFGTGSAEEEAQWGWLAAQEGAKPTILLLHKPLFQTAAEDAAPHIRYVPLHPRRKLLALLRRFDLRLVLSGHTHQYLDRMIDGIRHVWVPSTAFCLPDGMQERIGEKITGLAILDLTADSYRFHIVNPDGMVRHNLLDHPVYPGVTELREKLGKAARL